MSAGERYRKLPGRRRGVIIGSSVWMGSDHLLAVRSMRIREEYRRYHFRDIQAITVARAPRFHVSSGQLVLAILWLIGYLIAASRMPRYTAIFWTAAALAVVAWVVISARFSCRCRIYTAVSKDELPSVYRLWTARKFLERVTPPILEVQGLVPANWAEIAEEPAAGEPEPALSGMPDAAGAGEAHGEVHTVAADLFVATLWANALADLLQLHSTSQAANWTQIVFGLLLLSETVVLFVQYYRKMLQGAMQKLAIANLIAVGAMYYVRQMVFSFRNATKNPAAQMVIPTFYAGDALTRGISAGICIILGLVGLGIIFLHRDSRSAPGIAA